MFGPVFVGEAAGGIGDLLGKVAAVGAVFPLQHGRHRDGVSLLQLPQPGGAGALARDSIRHIEHIVYIGTVGGIVQQSDAPRTAPDVPSHPLVPHAVSGAGDRIRTLGKNQQLVGVGVFIEP